MSKIQFEQVDENEVEVILPADTPLEMVTALTKSFLSKGLVEDLKKSTVSTRYYFRPQDKVNQMADELIKSLSGLTKDEAYWGRKSKATMRIKNDVKDAVAARKPKPLNTAPGTPNKMYDSHPNSAWTADGTGKRYAYINDPIKKIEEHAADCECGQCEEIEKSGYGPKGASQYRVADNARRKMSNTGDVVDLGNNNNVKSYSSKPGQPSGKAQAALTARIQAAANKKQPVKQWSAEQIAAENEKRGLKKSWGQHLPFPSAEEEIMRLAKNEPIDGEAAVANQLAGLMAGKNMLGVTPPPQPTDEQMFGHLAVSDEMAKARQDQWGNTMNNWLAEATKPISQRFNSEEEELAYWANIKVADRDDGSSGY